MAEIVKVTFDTAMSDDEDMMEKHSMHIMVEDPNQVRILNYLSVKEM
jgi:hypothetical protein